MGLGPYPQLSPNRYEGTLFCLVSIRDADDKCTIAHLLPLSIMGVDINMASMS